MVPLPRIKLGNPPYQEGSLSLAYGGKNINSNIKYCELFIYQIKKIRIAS